MVLLLECTATKGALIYLFPYECLLFLMTTRIASQTQHLKEFFPYHLKLVRLLMILFWLLNLFLVEGEGREVEGEGREGAGGLHLLHQRMKNSLFQL